MREQIRMGNDPLGDAFVQLRSPEQRRPLGATYTPEIIVAAMIRWAAEHEAPTRIIDPGAGSGRFVLAAADVFPDAKLVAIERDPLAALMLRANLAVRGLLPRATIIVGDYCTAPIGRVHGPSLFIGNPPYVRHHQIDAASKSWFGEAAKALDVPASKLSGLHIHFYLRTAQLAKRGDFGTFITSSEWLDVNYGKTLRHLLAGKLGGRALHVLDAKALPFAGAMTTGAITCFHVGARLPVLKVRAVKSLDKLNGLSSGKPINWSDIEKLPRWSVLLRAPKDVPAGCVELGELCRVHRGQVTEKHFFFRHIVEDGSCPAQTRSGLTEEDIRARKYHGQRESDAHLRIKALIERSLCADPTFHTILQEKVWRAARNPQSRRQPDVQASSTAGRFAFEAQLSTTFLDVVVGRRMFYCNEGALLVWVLAQFTPDYRRLTTDDLLFSNNSNVFVVDDETTRLSEATCLFHLRCFHRRPIRDQDRISDEWDERIVRFDELTCDSAGQRIFYFDYEGSAGALRNEIKCDREKRKWHENEELREAVYAFWQDMGPHFDHRPESFARWNALRSRLHAQGMAMPDVPDGDSNVRALLNALFSAKMGRPVGWGFKNLIEVAHHLAQGYPQHLLA
ncbi:MAG TPA: DUF6035 family protein, partial [Bryobacteraceae bacterium]|nr:DUF6035 family protein [Bryobacteraceae bacterium]